MMVMPWTSARTSRRRFTDLKVAMASMIASVGTPCPEASAAAAVALKALCSPGMGRVRVAKNSPLRLRVQVVVVPSWVRLLKCQKELGRRP